MSNNQRKHVLHYRTQNVKADGTPKRPEGADLQHGEIAMNYANGKESLFIKNVDGGVVRFPNEKDLENVRQNILNVVASMGSWVFMIRKHGNSDANAWKWIGNQEDIKQIAHHHHLGWFKTKSDYKVCQKGRISVDVNGNPIDMEGGDGDLLPFFDCDMYIYGATIEDPTDGLVDIKGIGTYEIMLYGKHSYHLPPCGIFADKAQNYTDARTNKTSTHCNRKLKTNGGGGSGSNNTTIVKAGTGGANYFAQNPNANHSINAVTSFVYSQNKNESPETHSDGWYPEYYLAYDLWLYMMEMEMGTLNHTGRATEFGSGNAYPFDTWTNDLFYNGSAINSNCGLLLLGEKDGAAQSMFKQFVTTDVYDGIASCRGARVFGDNNGEWGGSFNSLPLLEGHKVLDDIVKEGLVAHVGDASKIFAYVTRPLTPVNEGDPTSETRLEIVTGVNPLTGEGMDDGKFYYQVRNVKKTIGSNTIELEGIADGVYTAVVTMYTKFTPIDNLKSGGVSLSAIIAKQSASLYRGKVFNHGAFEHTFGAHYIATSTTPTGGSRQKYYNYIYQPDYRKLPFVRSADYNTVADWSGSVGTELYFEKNFIHVDGDIPTGDGWRKDANPEYGSFYCTAVGGSSTTYECGYIWKSFSWATPNNGGDSFPASGYKTVNASVVGCSANDAFASACTVACSGSLRYSPGHYCAASALIGIQ